MKQFIKIGIALIIPLYMLSCSFSPSEWHFVDNIDLIFHEAGHTILFFLPSLLVAAAGSFMQVIIPVIVAIHFLLKGERVSSAIMLSWAGQSMINVSVYAKDSVVMQLPLLGGDSVSHDWNYMLSTLNLLKYTTQIWVTIYIMGIALIVTSIFLVIYYSLKKKDEQRLYADRILSGQQ